MLKNKTKIFLLFSIILITIIGISCVSAADTNDTSTSTQHTTDTPTISNDNIGNNIVKDVQSTSKDDKKIKTETKEIKKTDKNKENTKTIINPEGWDFSLDYAREIEPGSNLTVTYYISDYSEAEEIYVRLYYKTGFTSTLMETGHRDLGGRSYPDGIIGSFDFENLYPIEGATSYYITLDYVNSNSEGFKIDEYDGYTFSFGSAEPTVQIDDVRVSTYGGSLLALENNTIKVSLSSDKDVTSPVQVNLTIGNYMASQTVDSFSADTGAEVVFDNYCPGTAGDVEVIVMMEFNGIITGRNLEMPVYYNGYMGKSFTDNVNMTNAAVYEGYNTVKVFNVSDYIRAGWTQQTFKFDAASNGIIDTSKVVDVLYYVPYTYSQGLDFTVIANDELINTKASYVDEKGFGSYNYPYGLMVFNLTEAFKANDENTIVLTPGISNNVGLYGTYLVVVYANTNKRSKIVISEDCDMLSTTSTSYGATSDTAISYANYENVDVENLTSSKLIVIAGGSNNITNVLFNDVNMGSLDSAYNNDNQLSVFTTELDNVVSGTNNVAIQSVNDNLYTFNSILVTTYESKPPISIEPAEIEVGDDVTITVSLVDEIGEIDDGKVIFRINDKILRDEKGNVITADVIDGVATLPDVSVTSNWMKTDTTIQAVYTGTDTIEPFTTEPITVTVTKKTVTLELTGATTGKAGETVTLSVNVKDENNNNLNTGRVSFKLNGKTLKDEDGKALYVNVQNGVASTPYMIPAKTKAKTYPFTAVFTDTEYERTDVQSEFVISK